VTRAAGREMMGAARMEIKKNRQKFQL